MPFQGFGRVDRALFVSDGPGSVVRDIPSADGVFWPVLHQPIEQLLCGLLVRLFDRCFGRWSPFAEPLKNRCHRQRPSWVGVVPVAG